ncbi:hypothetical protein LY78DRAFT_296542 [Colletotrichum sublineola]|nr:hypothetical protein LY78DRAFT_296542 [Colletotrichum sublineola]
MPVEQLEKHAWLCFVSSPMSKPHVLDNPRSSLGGGGNVNMNQLNSNQTPDPLPTPDMGVGWFTCNQSTSESHQLYSAYTQYTYYIMPTSPDLSPEGPSTPHLRAVALPECQGANLAPNTHSVCRLHSPLLPFCSPHSHSLPDDVPNISSAT